jgi:ubiquinone/menaquinone biosynthesis C-methylase UbiE
MTADRPGPSASGAVWASTDVASGWQRGEAARMRAMGPATELLLDLAGVGAGGHILDLGTGAGDQAILAARRVGPHGRVLATDISGAMLDLTRAAADAAGLVHVQTRVMDAQQLLLDDGSFDAVIARFSLQFVPDVQRALAEVHRVLKPDGRFAAMVYSAVEKNPYRAGSQAIASRLARRPFPEPGPGQWALDDSATLAEAFQQAGFRAVEVRVVPITWRFASLAEALRNLEEAQPLFAKLMAQLSEADRATAQAEIEQMLRPFVGPDGFAAPSEALIAAGTRS